jgi:glycosyltransferase involved in cell wall biosynthesis
MNSSSKVQTSVIIPTYNYGRFLREALDSVLAQTVGDFEVIVVDDGSTDNTPDILASMSDPRLRSVRIPNSGIAGARNQGLREASGEFIAFLDSDDRWLPHKLELQLSILMSEPSVGVVFTDFVRFNRDGFLPNHFSFCPELAKLKTRPASHGPGRVITGDAFCELISFRLFLTFAQTLLYRRPVAEGLEFPARLRLSQDLYYIMHLYARTRVAFIPEPLVEVRRHGNNSSGPGIEKAKWDLEALLMLESDALSAPRNKAVRARIGRCLAGIGYQYALERKLASAGAFYLRSLGYPSYRLNALRHLLTLPFAPRSHS